MEQINRFSIKPKKAKKNDATVVLCGATSLFRMKTFGPKPLFSYNNSKLIKLQIDTVRSIHHDTDIILTIGHMADRLLRVDYGVRLIENQLYETTGIAEEIRLAINAANTSSVIIIDGDIFFNQDAFKLLYYANTSCVIQGAMPDEEPGMIVHKNHVSNMAYDLFPKWGQMCVLAGNELKAAKKILNSRENTHLLFHELINKIIVSGGNFEVVGHKDVVLNKLNSPKVLKYARSNQEV